MIGHWAQHAIRYKAAARGTIFRRTFDELRDAIEKSRVILSPMGWRYLESKYVWTSPDGAILYMRHLDRDSDANLYQGHEMTWQGFDEIGNFASSTPIDLLFAALRSPVAGIKKQRILTANPGGPGHAWVKARYITRTPLELFEYAPQPSRPDLTISACFIPGRLEDNVTLMENDPGYETKIAASTMGNEALWRAWRYGDWDVIAGAYFDCFTEATCTYDDDPEIKPWFARWISVDWGFKHDAAVYWFATDGNGRIWTEREIVVARHEPAELGRLIAESTPREHRSALDALYLSPEVFDKDTSAKTIATEIGAELVKFGLPYPSRADNARVSGWMLMYQLLKTGRWKISRQCKRLIECLPSLQRDPKHPEDILKIDGDDPGDSARYGVKTRDLTVNIPVAVVIANRMQAEVVPQASLTDKTIHARRITKEETDKAAPTFYARRGRWR